MIQERFVEVHQVPRTKRGRPKKNITPTSLGYEFLETYRRLKAKTCHNSNQR
jgi:hypothetical protein